MLNETEAWPGSEIVLEQFNILLRTFGQRFYAAVVQVLHIADHLMPRGRALRKEAIADALHVAADKKSASYHPGNIRMTQRLPGLFALNGI